MDYEILKPILIYKYNIEEMNRQDNFVEAMMSDANIIGSLYGKMDGE